METPDKLISVGIHSDEFLGSGSDQPPFLSANLSLLMRQHDRYIANLSLWKQYLVWRYTIGSGSVNKTLIGIPDPDNSAIWVYQFFKYFNYDLINIGTGFQRFRSYFEDPKEFLSLPARQGGNRQSGHLPVCQTVDPNHSGGSTGAR